MAGIVKPQTTTIRLVSVAHAADFAGVCTKTVRRWISSGDLTGYRVGRRLIRVDLNELESLMRPIPTVRVGATA